MSKTTYEINQSNNKSQINDTIELTIKDPETGSGSALIIAGKEKLGPCEMRNWTCYHNGMAWVFTPDVIVEENSTFFKNNNGKKPSQYKSMIGYTFLSLAIASEDETPPGVGSGTGGNTGTD